MIPFTLSKRWRNFMVNQFFVCVINPEASLNEATLDKQSWCVFTVIP